MKNVKDKIKVLFLVTQSEFGGAQRYIFEVVTHLNPQKYEILVAAGGDGELFLKLKNTQVRPVYLKWMKRTPWPRQMIFAIKEIFNLLKREGPNVLFLCSTTAGLLGSVAAFFYNLKPKTYHLKTIYRIGGWSFRDPRPFWQNKILLWAEKLIAPLKDKIIVNCESDRQLAIKYKICPTEKIIKIYNGIDINSLNFLPKEEAREILFSKTLSLKPKTLNLVIGCVANFYKTKGLPYLIEASHLLNTKYSILNTKYFVIGDGKERKKIESLIKKYNLENTVFLLGRIPNAYRYLKAFDIFVLPSLKEGFPWIILEAMAAEIPIVVTNVGALLEIIEDGVDGLLVGPGNSQILTEKIFWLINHQKEAKGLGLKAREKLKKFTLEKMVEETEKIIND